MLEIDNMWDVEFTTLWESISNISKKDTAEDQEEELDASIKSLFIDVLKEDLKEDVVT